MKLSPFANRWTTTLAHPLEGRPLSEQVSDEECDKLAQAKAPEGFVLHTVVQGRDKKGVRVLQATFARIEPVAFNTDRVPYPITVRMESNS